MLRLLWGPLIFIGVLSCLAALSLRLLTRPEPIRFHTARMLDEKILVSPSGWQTVSMLDGGRTGLYYDAPEDFIRARGRPIESALLLGLGGGEMLRSVRRASPNARLMGVEIDARVVELAAAEFGVTGLGNCIVVVADATSWVKTQPDVFDVVMVDLFNDSEIVPAVFDPRFWQAVALSLQPGGLLIVNASTESNATRITDAMTNALTGAEVRTVAYGQVVVLAVAR